MKVSLANMQLIAISQQAHSPNRSTSAMSIATNSCSPTSTSSSPTSTLSSSLTTSVVSNVKIMGTTLGGPLKLHKKIKNKIVTLEAFTCVSKSQELTQHSQDSATQQRGRRYCLIFDFHSITH